MYVLRSSAFRDELCVLSVRTDALDIPGVVVSDRNAAAAYALFLPSGEGLRRIEAARVFARDWKQRRTPPFGDDEIALAIRNLSWLGWITVGASASLPVPDEFAVEQPPYSSS